MASEDAKSVISKYAEFKMPFRFYCNTCFSYHKIFKYWKMVYEQYWLKFGRFVFHTFIIVLVFIFSYTIIECLLFRNKSLIFIISFIYLLSCVIEIVIENNQFSILVCLDGILIFLKISMSNFNLKDKKFVLFSSQMRFNR